MNNDIYLLFQTNPETLHPETLQKFAKEPGNFATFVKQTRKLYNFCQTNPETLQKIAKEPGNFAFFVKRTRKLCHFCQTNPETLQLLSNKPGNFAKR